MLNAYASAIHRDLPYAARDSRNRLDLYLPKTDGPPPLVVVIHGGGFTGGDKAGTQGRGPLGGKELLEAGFAVAAINYRLAPETVWPGQLEDLHDAFGFLRSAGPAHGYDPDRIGVFGASAGGYFAAMAAIALAQDPTTRLKAAALWYPPIDFAKMDADLAAAGTPPEGPPHASPGSPESQLIGAAVEDNPELAWLASPLAYVQELHQDVPLPAMLIQHGAKDPLIAHGQSLRLVHALAARPRPPQVTFQLLPDGAHGAGSFGDPKPLGDVVAFLASELGVS